MLYPRRTREEIVWLPTSHVLDVAITIDLFHYLQGDVSRHKLGTLILWVHVLEQLC